MIIYTDGSAHPNPGPGGFGVVVYNNNNNLIDCYQHFEENTTNNRQEIKAILYAFLKYGKKWDSNSDIPTVYSDSNYCVNTLTLWMFSWAKDGWIKSDKKIPENLDLIRAYYDWYKKGYRINLQKISGHKGIKGNELADKLARNLIKSKDLIKVI